MKHPSMNNRGQAFQDLSKIAIGLLGFVLAIVVMFLIISQGLTQIGSTEGLDATNKNLTECGSSVACNATTLLQGHAAEIVDWVPIVIIVSIGTILFTLIAGFVVVQSKNR